MNQKYTEAQLAILQLWEGWARDPATATYGEMQEFYCWLEKHHAALLTFPVGSGADRWQDIRGWLNRRTGYGGQR